MTLKPEKLKLRIDQAKRLAEMSPCPRGKFGAVAFDPASFIILGEGWNGLARGEPGPLCAGAECERDTQGCASGTRYELGCHHAESNICHNAARLGVSLLGAWLVVNGEPCRMCAQAIHHSGIARVYYIKGGFGGQNGLEYLRKYGVEVCPIDAT